MRAQLAFVLAHEASHYQRRHTLQRWQEIRAARNVAVLTQIVSIDFGLYPILAVGFPLAMGTIGNVYAFSRDQEREADALGFERLTKAGYNPGNTPELWRNLLAEDTTSEKDGQSLFFATHPSSEERLAALRDMAEAKRTGGFTGESELRAATLPFRGAWLRDELRTRDFARFHVVLDNLKPSNLNLGELYYFEGESYRLRAEPSDDRLAISAYLRAIGEPGTPPDVYRGLGEMYRRAGDAEQARTSFHEYLRLRPDAPERAMIEAYLQNGQ
jgi:predicted Zn-dependent protease